MYGIGHKSDPMEKKVGPTRLEGWGLVVVDMQNDFPAVGGYYARKRTLDEQLEQRTITPEVCNRLLCQPSTAPAEGFSYRADSLPRSVANTVIEFARAQHRPIAYVQAVYSREFDVQPPFLRQDPRREHYPCKPHSSDPNLLIFRSK
jgi:nicotinamidase-related amidase